MSIGTNFPRIDGPDKFAGRALYVDDLSIPGTWHGGTVRSTVARGRIRSIQFDPAVNWDEFAVVDHRDIPGENVVALIEDDMPALAADEIRHLHEPILLLAHPSIRKLREALRAVVVEVEPLPAITDPEQPLTSELIQFRRDNVFKRIDIRKGDPGAMFPAAARVVEGEYRTGAQEHVYLETNGMLANVEDGRLVVRGSLQCPYYVLAALARCFGQPPDAFRVVQTHTGGAFGGKEDFPSVLAIHAALLAEKAGHPVKIIYERQEDMAATTKRHPSRVRHRTALDDDGRLLAMEIDVLLDGGAYTTLSPVVLSRGAIHAAGPYRCDNVHIHAVAKLTNSPPYGAFRGFGAPQTIFALERHMDVIARSIGIEPAELRRRNLLRPGDTLATGQEVREDVDLAAMMDRALELGVHKQRRRWHAEFNRAHRYLRRGMGIATYMHGSGFTGIGEVHLASEVWVEGLPDGSIEVLTAQTEMGQGTITILTQIAADHLGLAPEYVRIATPDTLRVPNSGPTVASRTAMVVGNLVTQACDELRRQVNSNTSISGEALIAAIRLWHARRKDGKRLLGRARYVKPSEIEWDEQTYRGDAYAAYAWATQVAEVEVDLRTFATRVVDFVAVQDVGKVIHPTLAAGQIQGGVAQGIGWALYEDVILEDGAMKNNQMTNYIIPSSGDLPPIRVHFDEHPSPYGPKGAKGLGELPMDGPAPTVVNAVCDALNTEINEIPLTPERLMQRVTETERNTDG
jgi:CO/xanthine dehydrogenase Mo-binding subunit